MFTGLTQTTGRLRARTRRGPGFRLEIETELGPLELGESIAVNGACLTVVAMSPGAFDADISVETAEKTTLGTTQVGGRVNLERSLTLNQRLGGHLVSGHVDGVARVASITPRGEAVELWIEHSPELARFIAAKGSVTLDGVSLTVNAVTGTRFQVMLIPHTQAVTTLGELAVGSALNLEVDLLARYVARQLEFVTSAGGAEASLRRALESFGVPSEQLK